MPVDLLFNQCISSIVENAQIFSLQIKMLLIYLSVDAVIQIHNNEKRRRTNQLSTNISDSLSVFY